jgi:hypothetical protein
MTYICRMNIRRTHTNTTTTTSVAGTIMSNIRTIATIITITL